MYVEELMTPAARVRTVTRDTGLREAARFMREDDTGVLPVNDGDTLVGILTDRDIAIRAVAEGMPADTPVGEIMTGEVLYCYADAPSEDVIANMRDNAIRRMPVVDRDRNLRGMVSIVDLTKGNPETAGEALARIHDQPPQT